MKKEYKLLSVEEKGDISWVTIMRAADRNSINTPLIREMELLLDELENTDSRAAVFTGEGDTHFIGGADGIEMMQCDTVAARVFSERIQRLFNRMEESPLILVAAINGLCFGGGYEFALACDFRIASMDARIGLPEVRLGLIPGGGGTQRLPGLVGMGRAMEMILSGRMYKAKDALELGLIHRVAGRDRLMDVVKQFLEPIFYNPQYALSQAKRAVRATQRLGLAEGLRVESAEFQKCLEKDFFADTMCEQLKSGILKTTETLPDWAKEKMESDE